MKILEKIKDRRFPLQTEKIFIRKKRTVRWICLSLVPSYYKGLFPPPSISINIKTAKVASSKEKSSESKERISNVENIKYFSFLHMIKNSVPMSFWFKFHGISQKKRKEFFNFWSLDTYEICHFSTPWQCWCYCRLVTLLRNINILCSAQSEREKEGKWLSHKNQLDHFSLLWFTEIVWQSFGLYCTHRIGLIEFYIQT